MVSNCSLSDSSLRRPQISKTLLCILTNLNNALVWIFLLFLCLPAPLSIFWGLLHEHQLQLISPSPSCSIIFNSLARSGYLSFFSLSFDFTLWYAWLASSQIVNFSFLLLTVSRSRGLVEIRWSVYSSKSQWILSVSFFGTYFELFLYYLFKWSNLNFLHNSQWIILPIQSYLILLFLS